MELTINELDDYHSSNGKNVTWQLPETNETDGTNERAFSAQQYNPDDLQPRSNNAPLNHAPLNHAPLNHAPLNHAPLNHAPLNRRQVSQQPPQPQPQVNKNPLNYDDILLKLNVQIVNGVMRYVDPRKGFTFENSVITKLKPQVKPQVNASAQPLTLEEHKECRIKQEMDRRRLNQVKTTKMLIPNNKATISRPSATAAPSVKAPVTNNSGLFKMKMGR